MDVEGLEENAIEAIKAIANSETLSDDAKADIFDRVRDAVDIAWSAVTDEDYEVGFDEDEDDEFDEDEEVEDLDE